MNQPDSELVSKGPCQDCGSSDACATYDDGHSYCYSCRTHRKGDVMTNVVEKPKASGLVASGSYQDLPKRRITEETCRRYGYTVDGRQHIAPYYNQDGTLCGQKLRRANKQFSVAGSIKGARLFGSQAFQKGGKRLVITEGEIDAMAAYQMQGGWPAVSVPSGAQSALRSIRDNIEFVESFDEVLLCFDMDEPGRAAAKEVAEILTPGRAKIVELPRKDAGEMLENREEKTFRSCLYQAREHRPDGIVNLADTWDMVAHEAEMGNPYPWDDLNTLTYGMRPGEIITLTAGSGVGKSTVAAEIAYDLLVNQGETVGYVALEEGIRRTAQRFVGMAAGAPIHLPGVDVSIEKRRDAFEKTAGTGRLYSYDHFGSLDAGNLMAKLRYLVVGCGCRWLVLDHLSIVISGMDLDGDERRALDHTMTALRSFTEETGVGLILVCHLKRPEGRSHEEGGRVTLAQLRGSGAIAQLSDVVIGCERDQQSEDQDERNEINVRVLKSRFSGLTGIGATLRYEHETGRLVHVENKRAEDALSDLDDAPF